MAKTFRTIQVIRAADISRHTLDRWISSGYFTPQYNPENGEAREFEMREVFQIAAMAELFRLGISMTNPVMGAARYLSLYKNDAAYLVIWQGPAQLIKSSRRGDPAPERKSGGATFYNPDQPPVQHDVVSATKLLSFVDDPDKRSIAILNLDYLEKRVLQALQAASGE